MRPSLISSKEFWDTSHIYNPALTDEVLRLGEKSLGVKLPVELLDLLRIQNGGYTKGFVFPTSVPTSWAANHIPFDELGGINPQAEPGALFCLTKSTYVAGEFELPVGQIILGGDGHYFVTLDYRDSDVPSVAWIDTECGQDIQLADTFHEFLSKLVSVDEFEDKL